MEGEKVIFRSPYLNYAIVLKNTHIQVIDGVPVVNRALTVKFMDGRVTVDETTAKLMRANSDYKIKYFDVDSKIDKQVDIPSAVRSGVINSAQVAVTRGNR